MSMQVLCYRIETLPDLSLNKYSALNGRGVSGVLEQHSAFLRQWNRKGLLSDVSIHLFYLYDGRTPAEDYARGIRGSKLEVLFVVRGEERQMANVPQLVAASPVSPYFQLQPCQLSDVLREYRLDANVFPTCCTLLKKEVFIRASGGGEDYYTVPQWKMSEEGRLFNLSRTMEALDRRAIYRVDLYPVDVGDSLRAGLRNPMTALRERQANRSARDYSADEVLKSYDDLLKRVDQSPAFRANVFVFADDAENAAVILDAAGAEALSEGSYEIANFGGRFGARSFWDPSEEVDYFSRKKRVFLQRTPGSRALIASKVESADHGLRFLPTLFTLEEAEPFFRFPALYDGEVIQRRKETAPPAVDESESLYLGRDDNNYPVFFPLKNLQKHAFIAGVPGSGKTNTMHHLTSTLWKKHRIPFLVLEPAKQEYRALVNEPGMEDLYIFSPNADMQFPLHINPFEFPKGLLLAEHIRRLCAVFEGAFPLENPMPFLLDSAIELVYRDCGWTPETRYTEQTTLKFPTMSMLYKKLEELLEKTKYSDEVQGNLQSALQVRIGSLLRREMGDVFNVPKSTIPPEDWIRIPAVIELEAMGTGPANFLTLMLCSLIRETLKVNPHFDKKYARHVIFIEEAHNLIGPESEEKTGADADPKTAATAFVVKMLAEVRALKEGIVIADQLPTVMAPEVLKNTGLKIGLRITSTDDRSVLGGTMAANGMQLEEMATFNVGRALISYEGLQRPFTMQTHEWLSDVFEDREERSAATESPNDVELADILWDLEPYRITRRRSFSIELMGFQNERDGLMEEIKRLAPLCTAFKREELRLQQAYEERQDYTASEIAALLKPHDEIVRRGQKRSGEIVALIQNLYSLAARMRHREEHWSNLGFDGFATILARRSQLESQGQKLTTEEILVWQERTMLNQTLKLAKNTYFDFEWALPESFKRELGPVIEASR